MNKVMRTIVVALLAAFTIGACADGSTPNVDDTSNFDAQPAVADILIPPDQGNEQDVANDTTDNDVDKPSGCELHPMFSKQIGEPIACALEVTPDNVDHCVLELYESNGKCAARCQPAFHELIVDLQITPHGFCMMKAKGLKHCSFGSKVIFPENVPVP